MTSIENKINIVADVWLNHSVEFHEFVNEYDLGCPLAAAILLGGVDKNEGVTEIGAMWITEAFDALVEGFGLDPFGDYEDLATMLDLANAEG